MTQNNKISIRLIDFNDRATRLGLTYCLGVGESRLLYVHVYIFCVLSLKILLHSAHVKTNNF